LIVNYGCFACGIEKSLRDVRLQYNDIYRIYAKRVLHRKAMSLRRSPLQIGMFLCGCSENAMGG